MRKVLLCLLFITSIITSFSQPYSIGHRELTWIDSSRSYRAVMFEVYYPASATADNAPVVSNGKQFALIVFGHGYQLTYKDYLWLKDSIVPKGYFIVFPRTEEKLFPSHTDFAKDFAFLVNQFKITDKNRNSWFYLRLTNKSAVAGHSMGGGCSLLSVQYSPNIMAVFNFAAAETNPSAIAASKNIALPALIFAGGKDCVAPPSSNQLPMYNNIQNICKTYVQVTDARHCQWANNNGTCRLGEFFCSPATTSSSAVFKASINLLYPWLNYKLRGNQSEAEKFQTALTSATGITYQQNCVTNKIVNNDDINKNYQLKVYPSVMPAGTLININLPVMQQPNLLQVFNQSGKIVLTKNIASFNNQTLQISSANLQKGIYFIIVTDGKLQYKNSFMVESN